MYRYILFDLDGTLTDSREGIFNSVRYSLEKLGRPCPSYETLLRFVGPPLQDSFECYCGMDKEEAWRAVEVFRERYETIGWAENKAADGIVELMSRLKGLRPGHRILQARAQRGAHRGKIRFYPLPFRRLRQRRKERGQG